MKILGIHDGHNSAVALICDGRLEIALQEERFTYEKNAGGLPIQALKHLNQSHDLSDVDVIAFCGQYMGTFDWSREAIIQSYKESSSQKNILKQSVKQSSLINSCYQKSKNNKRLSNLPPFLDKNKIIYIDHHLCHASSAYFGNGDFEQKILVLTCDGSGDDRAASAYIGHKGELSSLVSIAERDSLGRIYSYMTYLYNMVPYEHEFKIMGMAPYCADYKRINVCKKKFEALFQWSKDDSQWSYCGKFPSIQSAGNELKEIFNETRFDILAAAVQMFTEETLVRWIKALIRKTGINHLVLGGGVFMNVKANHLIASIEGVESCFAFPSCGDDSNAIGAAYLAYFENAGEYPEKLTDYYLGDELVVDEDVLDGTSDIYSYECCEDIEEKIATLLAEGAIVGRISGRMEFGARSLGNRAILANPSFPDTLRTINEMIKGRDFWMPFAPSLLAEDLDKYFVRNEAVKTYGYMMFTADSHPEVREYAKAALHPYDYSGRPNAVTKESNASYYRLLKCFQEKTGESLVLNTSYNLHGYPMVRDGKQALHVFMNSDLKFLAYGDYLLRKSK